MRFLCSLGLSTLTCLCLSSSAAAVEIHVFPGELIQAALDTAGPGDTVIVHAGTYAETLTLPSGNASQAFTLKAADGERVVVTGMRAITGWAPHSANVWVASTDFEPIQLIVRAQEQTLAREPNEGWWKPESINLSGANPVFVDSIHLPGQPAALINGTAFVYKKPAKSFSSLAFLSFSPATASFTLDTSTTNFSPDDIYWLQGRKELIDMPGEWAVESAGGGMFNVYFWPVSTLDLTEVEAPYAPTRIIDVNGGRNVHIEGLEVKGALLYGVHVHNNSQDVTVTRCLVHHVYHAGIYVRYSENITVANNIVVKCRYGFDSDNMVNLVVENNEIAWNTEDGLKVSFDSTNVTVRGNFLHDHISWNHPDNLQTYADPSDLHYLDNLCIAGSQTFMSEDTSNVELDNNMSIGSSASGIISGGGNSSWQILNNTFAYAGYFPISFSTNGVGFDHRENIVVNGHQNYLYRVVASNLYTGNRNLFWKSARLDSTRILTYENNWSQTLAQFQSLTGQEMNSVNADPLFHHAPMLFNMTDNRILEQQTRATLILRSLPQGWQVGDVVDYNLDGIPRTITNIDGYAITLDPPLPAKPLSYAMVANWGPAVQNLVLDLRLRSSSPAIALSAGGGSIGSTIHVNAYCAGDFNDDGVRDLPLLPPELADTARYGGCRLGLIFAEDFEDGTAARWSQVVPSPM